MKTLYLTCGLPGSGKTTYVNAHLAPKGVQVVCPDNLRLAYGHSFYGPIEPHIHAQVYLTVRAQMYRGLDVVVDECHVRADHLKRWRRLADEMGYEMKLIRLLRPRRRLQKTPRRAEPQLPAGGHRPHGGQSRHGLARHRRPVPGEDHHDHPRRRNGADEA